MLLHFLTALQLAAPLASPPPVYHGRLNQTTVALPKLPAAEIRIDGALNEPAWAGAALLTGFSQYRPVDGQPAQDSTEVLVWYTDHELYIGVRAFEPHGPVRATLADRDKIFGDDWIGFVLDTFNDKRQGFMFLTNPLGVQADGMSNENQRGNNDDFSPDYMFQSKGRLTDYGYEVELRISFKTLRYQSAASQDWGFQVFRRVQHSGQDQTWTQTTTGQASFNAQAGTLQGLHDLKRGLVMDINPVATAHYSGTRIDPSTFRYADPEPEVGMNLRWGITTNLTLNATANPDFSQVESDAGQINFDPRTLLFFPEKRPFFLENNQQFNAPTALIYTRRIADPVAAAKFTGTVGGTDVGFLSAVDDRELSRTGGNHPFYNLLRLRRNVGRQSSLGLVYTDKADGEDYNRVAGVDGRLVFGGVYTMNFQVAGSFWRNPADTTSAPLWNLAFDRSGRRFGLSSQLQGIHDRFVAGSGFISRPGIVRQNLHARLISYGTPEDRVQTYTFGVVFDNTWDYQEFEEGIGPDDIKLHLKNDWTVRGGWRFGADFLIETFRYPARFYRNYFVEVQNAQGSALDTVPFHGRRRIPNYDLVLRGNTPQFARFSANGLFIVGRDENFEEWAPGYIVFLNGSVTWRPNDQLRTQFSYVEQRTIRPEDRSVVRLSRIPRLKLEYQVSRPFFVRLVGEYADSQRDVLRDGEDTGAPILIFNPRTGAYSRGNFSQQGLRGDLLLSYQPNPGTVIFAGYGTSALDTEPFGFRDLSRTSDGFFVKLSYLFRM